MDLAKSGAPVAFVYVTDRERGLAFYRDVLGLELHSSDGYGDFLHLGGGGLLRITLIKDHKPHEHPVLGWNVGDIEAAARALTAKGVTFIIYEGMGQDALGIWTGDDGDKMAFFADPDGNALTLSQV
jgi:catechol 2,3-dioxygenase-like lactoylglutathione lyase family enzyme